MKTYPGCRTESGCTVIVSDANGSCELRPRFDLRNHSPAGFEWGYGGSGPAQLALHRKGAFATLLTASHRDVVKAFPRLREEEGVRILES